MQKTPAEFVLQGDTCPPQAPFVRCCGMEM